MMDKNHLTKNEQKERVLLPSYQPGNLVRLVLLKGGSLIGLIGLSAFFALSSQHFLTISNVLNIFRQVSVVLIAACAQTMVIISAGIDLSVGPLIALGGSVGAVAMSYWGWDFLSGAFLGVIIAMLAGFTNGILIAKGKIPDFIGTLGMLGAFRGVALLITDGLPVPSHFTATALKGYLPPALVWLGAGDIFQIPAPMIVALIMIGITWFILMRTSFGRSIYAIGGNKEAARASGINVEWTKIWVYGLSGLYCGIGGLVLTGRMNSANALMAEGIELQTIAAVVIGGTNLFGGQGTIFGTFIGAILMGVLANGLNLLNVEPFWQRVINGIIIVSVVIFDQWRRRKLIS